MISSTSHIGRFTVTAVRNCIFLKFVCEFVECFEMKSSFEMQLGTQIERAVSIPRHRTPC